MTTVNALSQLEDYVKDKKYPDITQSLSVSMSFLRCTLLNHDPMQVVKEISASFKQYISVPRISQLWRRIQGLQGEIRALIESDFDT